MIRSINPCLFVCSIDRRGWGFELNSNGPKRESCMHRNQRAVSINWTVGILEKEFQSEREL